MPGQLPRTYLTPTRRTSKHAPAVPAAALDTGPRDKSYLVDGLGQRT